MVCSKLRHDFPHITLVGEEGGHETPNSEYRIFEDSIDGTIPFVMGILASTFCIALLRGNQPVKALIFDPFADRLWWALKGQGAYLGVGDNRKKLQVSDHSTLQRSYISTIWWKNCDYNMSQVGKQVEEGGAKWFNLCAVATCGGPIAGGSMHASIFPGRKGWETAAMQLIVEEAGGKATDIFGRPLEYGLRGEIDGHIISNGLLHDELVRIVASCQS